jgi:SsrA-binding protein
MKNGRALAVNRRARFEYEILETYEAGMVLLGTEIKAMREGRASIAEAYARPQDGELWLHNAHIAQYSAGGLNNHDPTRPRKLLMHKGEIEKLSRQVNERGLTLVPLRLYLKRHRAKLQVGLAKGRRLYDKRRVLVERERLREARQAVGRLVPRG